MMALASLMRKLARLKAQLKRETDAGEIVKTKEQINEITNEIKRIKGGGPVQPKAVTTATKTIYIHPNDIKYQYKMFRGREPTPSQLEYWMYNKQGYNALKKALKSTPLTPQIITDLYMHYFHKKPTTDKINYWQGKQAIDLYNALTAQLVYGQQQGPSQETQETQQTQQTQETQQTPTNQTTTQPTGESNTKLIMAGVGGLLLLLLLIKKKKK